MHFKPVQNDNGQWVPGIDDADTDVPKAVFEAARHVVDNYPAAVQRFCDFANAVASAGYSKGYDEGYNTGWESGANDGDENTGD